MHKMVSLPSMKITDILEQRASAAANEIAYRFLPNDRDEIELTYSELFDAADHLATKLADAACAGQRILLVYPAGLDFIIAFYACLLANAIPVPLPLPKPSDPMQRLNHVLQDCDPALIFTTSGSKTQVLGQLPEASHHLVVATDLQESVIDARLSSCLADSGIALLQYTSGSTSRPKGVQLSSENLTANLTQIEQTFGHNRESRGVIWLPHFHDMGLIGGILQPLFVGFPVTLFSPISFMQRPLRWLRAIHKYRATTSGGPNFAYDLCVNKARTAAEELDLDLSSWKVAFNGAEPVKLRTLASFSTAFAPNKFDNRAFLPCYGLAESTLLVSGGNIGPDVIASLASPLAEQNQMISCGSPAHGTTVHIRHVDSDDLCDEGKVGEVCISGASVSRGYWNQAAHDENTMRHTGVRTGDLGYLLRGELYITSRLKDLIIIRGKNVIPEDIENTVKDAHPLLEMEGAAAIGIPNDGTEDLVYIQELSARTLRGIDLAATHEAARDLVLDRHGITIKEFLAVPAGSLVRTSSGKISRSACRQLYINRSFDSISMQEVEPFNA